MELTHYRLFDLGKRHIALGESGAEYTLKPMTETGTALPHDPHMAHFSELVEQMNDLFAGDLTNADLVTYAQHITKKLLESDILAQQAATNSKEQFALGDFDNAFIDTVIEGLDNYQSMAEQVLGRERTREGLKTLVLELVYQGFVHGSGDCHCLRVGGWRNRLAGSDSHLLISVCAHWRSGVYSLYNKTPPLGAGTPSGGYLPNCHDQFGRLPDILDAFLVRIKSAQPSGNCQVGGGCFVALCNKQPWFDQIQEFGRWPVARG